MDNEIFTVDEVAQILGMHSKTIRRYISEGKLKGNKVGGQWRVKSTDLKAFMNKDEYSERIKSENKSELRDFVEGTDSVLSGRVQVCTIIDIYVNSPEEIKPVTQRLIDIMNSGDPSQGNAKFQYIYHAEEKKARFTLWGNPKFLAKMLDSLGNLID